MAMGATREQIMRLLLRHRAGLSTDELAGHLSLTRTAVRLHLAEMERDGHVAVGARRRSGGRPTQTYVLTQTGEETFPKHYHWLAELLLAHIVEAEGAQGAGDVLRDMGERLSRSLAPRTAGAPFAERVVAVTDALRDLEYVAESHVQGADRAEIHAYNCVFHRLAQKDQTICELDLAIIGGITGAAVDHLECMARGDHRCVFALTPKPPAEAGN